jgi:hypothetical protein
MNIIYKLNSNQKGTALVTLMVFMVVAVLVTTGAVMLASISTQGTSDFAQSEHVALLAEAGAETATLQILRNRDYTGETINISDAEVVVTVSGTSTKTITSTARKGDFIRKVEAVGDLNNNVFTIINWRLVE